jgi:PAS domain S-box-containing protein
VIQGIVFAIVLGAILITYLSWKFVKDQLTLQAQADFDQQVEKTIGIIEDRFNSYQNAIYSTRGLLDSSETVTSTEWATFVKSLNIAKQYPGITSLSYIQHVPAAEKDTFIKEMRKETTNTGVSLASFTIYPEATKDNYDVVKYIEPVAGREKTLGFDFGSEASRFQTLKTAAETGEPAITPRIISISNNKPAAALVLAVYKKENDPLGIEQKDLSKVMGFVTTGVQTNDLFANLLEKQKLTGAFGVKIYDGDDLSADHLLYNSMGDSTPHSVGFTTQKRLKVASRNWTLIFEAEPHFGITSAQQQNLHFIILGGGTFSVLLGGILLLLLSSQSRAERIASQMTQNLQESENKYRSMFESLQDVLYQTDMNGVVTTISPSIFKYIGLKPEQVIGRNAAEFYQNIQQRDEMMGELAKKGSVSDYLLTLKGPEGKLINVSLNAHLILDENQKPVGVEGVLRDVTYRLEAEEELKRKSAELEKFNNFMVGREVKMKELKKRIEQLEGLVTHVTS